MKIKLKYSNFNFENKTCIFIKYEMDTVTWVLILDETVCFSNSSNTVRKGMNPIILHPAMGK